MYQKLILILGILCGHDLLAIESSDEDRQRIEFAAEDDNDAHEREKVNTFGEDSENILRKDVVLTIISPKKDSKSSSFLLKHLLTFIKEKAQNETKSKDIFFETGTVVLGGLAIAGIIAGGTQLILYCPRNSQDNFCIAGYYYLGTGLVSLVLSPIPYVINYFYKKKIQTKWHTYTDQKVMNERHEDEALSEQDILDFGEIIVHVSYSRLFKEFNEIQALTLARVDREKFCAMVDNRWFRDNVHSSSAKPLCSMLDMDAEQLAKHLGNKKMIKKFKAMPILLQTLVQTLPSEILSNKNVRKALVKRLSSLLLGNPQREKTIEILNEIANGKSIWNYDLKDL